MRWKAEKRGGGRGDSDGVFAAVLWEARIGVWRMLYVVYNRLGGFGAWWRFLRVVRS
jgi:hypothetical protein